ncbi:protein strawberry notch homolog 1-like isoform X2 [Dysidea avara]|uniref:protein strawberry notch homolog 1-like isoform X2 n=1 Tax=Dysidea avara TaxID=196820 RepID=UPI00331873D9
MSVSEEDILALALNNAASESPSISTAASDTSGLLDFLDIRHVLPVGPIVDPTIVPTQQQVLPVQQETDNLIDMLDLSNDKVDTISNNDLDSLLEEASKIEVSKDLEAVFKSPSTENNSKTFNLLQPAKPVLPVQIPAVPAKPVEQAAKPVGKAVAKPVEKLVPITKSNLVTVTKTNINPTKATVNPTTVPIVIPATASAATTAAAVAANFSVTEAFKVLGTTTTKPVISLQGQQLINLLSTSIVNSSTRAVSTLLNKPVVLSTTPGTSSATSSATTIVDRSKLLQKQLVTTKFNAQQVVKEVTAAVTSSQHIPQVNEELDSDDEDEYGAASTYANYLPAKLRIGRPHPDSVVESSSLSSVAPPSVWFDLKLPSEVVDECKLSALQLEAIVYSCQQHMNILTDGSRAGYLIGDGAGVGKGRTIAGIIYQNYLEGRKKAVWLSVSNDLKYDAIRDLRDIGAKKIAIHSLNKFHYGKISGKRNGRVKKGIIFATYSSLIGESSSGGKYRTRFNQLMHWLGPQFEGVVVFDECHKAKNLYPSGATKPSKTGLTVLELQKKLPKARVVYCSATGASEPRNMAYMSRLGIWGPGTQFNDFHDFIRAVERRGVGAMEIVAMDMKLRGMYIARQLSFHGVTFDIREVTISEKFREMFDASVELWMEAHRLFHEASVALEWDRSRSKGMWAQFWASHQRFFKYLCIAAKVPEAVKLTQKAIADGKCVVIGLQSTGEARTLEQLERSHGTLNDFVSTVKGVLETLIRRHFPTPSSGIDMRLFADDPTLPGNSRKRKRGAHGLFFDDDDDSSDTSSSEGSDSAVSSSDSEDEAVAAASGSGSDNSSSDSDNPNPFSSKSDNPWLSLVTEKKPKRRKLNPPKSKSSKSSPKPVSSDLISRASPTKLVNKNNTKETVKPVEVAPPEPSLLKMVTATNIPASSSHSAATVRQMKEELLKKVELLSSHLPANTLDQLIDELGGPECVAEMTGRRGRMVSLLDGSVQYQLRSEDDVSLELLNIAEKQRFMDGEKSIAIISEAASSGISLHADRRAKNRRRRVHITLELPWSADKAIQQFGRTHRSNQVSAPEYVFLISELAGEQRFASVVAKRLESLGALTHGDRRATETRDLSKYNIDTKYGRSALEIVLGSVVSQRQPIVHSEEYNKNFFEKLCAALVGVGIVVKAGSHYHLDKDSYNMTRFLNRILGLPVGLQNKLFNYFTDTLGALIQQAKRMGKWDNGILDFGAAGECVELVDSKEYVGDPAFGTSTTQLHKVQIERGISYSEALETFHVDTQPGEGFYLSKKVRPSTEEFMYHLRATNNLYDW